MKINNKYKIDDTVWYIKDNAIHCSKIVFMTIWVHSNTSHTIQYEVNSPYRDKFYEPKLYSSKENLLKTL